MLTAINNINVSPQYKILNNKYNSQLNAPKLQPLACDTVNFTGKLSLPSLYDTTFEYLAAEILRRKTSYPVDSRMLSHDKIKKAIDLLFEQGEVFKPFKKVLVDKIKWKDYVPMDVREGAIQKINDAREDRFAQWQHFLENPEGTALNDFEEYLPELVAKVKDNNPLKFVIWNAVKSEIKDNNRHIPVPFSQRALLKTIEEIEQIQPMSRAVRCPKPSFIDLYTHRLRDNLLMDLGLSDNLEVWVKVPSIKHDPKNKEKNIQMLEILSSKNWCTRSSVDKAIDALTEGDFHILLERDSMNMWQTRVGMSISKGQIDQIQGHENNNIIPLNYVEDIKKYTTEKKLILRSGITDEGPKAGSSILISEKLKETDSITKKTFFKAIKDEDNLAIFKFLGVKAQENENNLLSIGTYRPVYMLNAKKGIAIPYSMFGINEDKLLQNVQTINGDLILHRQNKLLSSLIKVFPPNLETVTGKVECSAEQFEQFGEDILRVVNNDRNRIKINKF